MSQDANARTLLKQLIHFDKYAKYLKELHRRETPRENVSRTETMHIRKLPHLADPIREAFQLVYDDKVLPSMRSLQYGGDPIIKNPARLYNCSATAIIHPRAFTEAFFLLLSGCGVGYSVQRQHVAQLPPIQRPRLDRRYLIVDTIEGWAEALDALLCAYFCGDPRPRFDPSDVRPAGSFLSTTGGRAPGPNPLLDALQRVESILADKKPGQQLETDEASDIMCHFAEAVLSGGVRRSSYVCIFSHDDPRMLHYKAGNWTETHPWRRMANIDAALLRSEHDESSFWKYWEIIAQSKYGEPAIFWTHNLDWLFNPCLEASLRFYTFCNLATINASTIECQSDLEHRARMAARIATIQATYTDFHLLRPEWKERTDEDALIGISMTGITAGNVERLDLQAAARVVLEENARMAKILGINPAKRTTLLKPEGTSSLRLGGVPCGIHSPERHGRYIRRLTLNKGSAIYEHAMAVAPELVEDSVYVPDREAFINIPLVHSGSGSSRSTESPIDLLERIRRFHQDWIEPGHREGDNQNNVSATVYVGQNEWDDVGEWMWEHRDSYTAISVFPQQDDTDFEQLVYQQIPDEEWERLAANVHKMKVSDVKEWEDGTEVRQTQACAGGVCEI